jgi:hypothetical protein
MFQSIASLCSTIDIKDLELENMDHRRKSSIKWVLLRKK